jgi:protease-4
MRTFVSLRGWVILLAAGMVVSASAAATSQPAKRREPAVKQKVELKPKVAEMEALPKVAHIRLGGIVLSSPPDFSLFAGQDQGMTLRDWVQRLATARNDGKVEAVALEVDAMLMDWSQAHELADAVERLNAVKPVHAHLTTCGALQYLVASAGREVTMDPAGTLMVVGLGGELVFFRGTLDWLGIRPQMIQIGRYKGAAEPFTRKDPSEDFKGEYNKILDDLYEQLCGQVARQRRLTVPHVKQAIDEGPLGASDARQYRLVDQLVAKADWQEHVVRKVAGRKHKSAAWLADYAGRKFRPIDFSNPLALLGTMFAGPKRAETRDPTIAIIHADGMIMSGKSGEGFFGGRYVGHKTMAKCFQEVAEDDKVKAVIFRIDSPGGSAMASEMIYQAARKCGQKKPVIVSIAGLGASGGYYIALGGREILADPPALVGSVGVVSGKLAMSGLLDKLGISTFEMTRGRNAGLWMSRPWDPREEAVVRNLTRQTYDIFVSRVKASRGSRVKDLSAVTQGRIFTARQAVRNGLIDKIGGLREAVIAAQEAAKIKRSYIITLPRPKTLTDLLYGQSAVSLPPDASPDVARRLTAGSTWLLSADPQKRAGRLYLMNLARLLDSESVLTAMPYHVSVRP